MKKIPVLSQEYNFQLCMSIVKFRLFEEMSINAREILYGYLQKRIYKEEEDYVF